MSDLWVNHYSAHTWLTPSVWTDYFNHVQALLGSPITRLDEHDPVRRKVESPEEAGRYVCDLKPAEQSRWIHGKLGKDGIHLGIFHHRKVTGYANMMTWYVPMSYLDKPENRLRIRALFDLGNQMLMSYHGWADDIEQVKDKKGEQGGAVNPQRELLGVLWLTYFNPAYVAYFGNEKFDAIPGVERAANGSITITLGERPASVAHGVRQQAAKTLGELSFAGYNVDPLGKRDGQHVLTFDQLRAAQSPAR